MRKMILLSAVSLLSILPLSSAFVLSPPLQATARLPYHPRHDRFAIRYTNGKDDAEELTSPLFSPLQIRHSFLDLNGDGKIDEQDLEVLQQRIVQYLDVNGDGHLDEKDAIQVLHLVILSWTLTATPAVAKGGGHGGGGGGGGHSSSSHSSSVHYSTSHGRAGGSSIGQSYYDSREYHRAWYGRNSKYDKPWNPAACHDLPGEGERILVSSPSLFYNRHDVPAIVTAVDETTCSFSVQGIQENRNDDDAFATQSFRTMRNWEDGDIFEVVLLSSLLLLEAGVNAVNTAHFQAKNEWFDKRFLVARQATAMEDEDFSSITTTTRQATPTSGRYVGTTRESDGAHQDIRVKLHFDDERRKIHGSGYDSDDGKYSVEGEWAGQMVKWKETYRNGGFTVDVRGTWNEDASKMDGWFVSSRGIRGTFVLRKKKKWGLIRSNKQRRA